jgi:hypothetical protein
MDDGYGLRVEGEGGAIASGVEGGLGRIEENTMEIMRLWRKSINRRHAEDCATGPQTPSLCYHAMRYRRAALRYTLW